MPFDSFSYSLVSLIPFIAYMFCAATVWIEDVAIAVGSFVITTLLFIISPLSATQCSDESNVAPTGWVMLQPINTSSARSLIEPPSLPSAVTDEFFIINFSDVPSPPAMPYALLLAFMVQLSIVSSVLKTNMAQSFWLNGQMYSWKGAKMLSFSFNGQMYSYNSRTL